MIKLEKVRASNLFRFVHSDGKKNTWWEIDPTDVDPLVLEDIVRTAVPPIQAATPLYQVGTQLNPQFVQPALPGLENYGAEAADRAAREEEQRLRNMGSAISKGIGLGPEDIPVFDNGELPDVNWSQ